MCKYKGDPVIVAFLPETSLVSVAEFEATQASLLLAVEIAPETLEAAIVTTI